MNRLDVGKRGMEESRNVRPMRMALDQFLDTNRTTRKDASNSTHARNDF